MKKLICTASAVLVSCAAAVAGPLNPAQVSKDAQWLVHVNLELLTGSPIGQMLLADGGPLEMSELRMVKEEFGMDPLTDVKSITIYGASLDDAKPAARVDVETDNVNVGVNASLEENAVIILETLDTIDGALAKAIEEGPGYKAIDGPYRTIHSWADGDEQFFASIFPADGDGRRTVAFATSEQTLNTALSVIQGKSQSLAQADKSDLAAAPRDGSFVYVEILDIDALDEFKARSAMMGGNLDGVALDLGIADQALFASLSLGIENAEKAQQMVAMAQGLIAAAQLANGANEELSSLLSLAQQLDIQTSDHQLEATLKLSMEELVNLMQLMEDHD